MSIYCAYTYLIHHKPTNTYYYGVRWKNIKQCKTPEEDLWIEYFTRSKRVKDLVEQYGKDSFEFQIRRKFNSVLAARKWETKVLRRMNVLSKPHTWLNRTDNKAILNEVHPRGTLGKTWRNKTTSDRNAVEKIGNKYTKNTFWIHNGTEKKMIPIGTEIPVGFMKGTGRTNKRPDLSLRNKMRAQERLSK